MIGFSVLCVNISQVNQCNFDREGDKVNVNIYACEILFLFVVSNLPRIIERKYSDTVIFSFGFLNSACVRTVVQYNRPGCNFNEHVVLYVVFSPTGSEPDLPL